jgi:pyruvate dehydrogenase E2 component (dihydrolipoamide acetyltransferase)
LFDFLMPDLGEGIAEGEILKWYVKEGGPVVEDEPLVDVETDKAAVTIPSPRGGVIVSLKGNVGDIINVGDVFVVIDDGSGAQAAPTAKTEAPTASMPAVMPAATPAVTPAVTPANAQAITPAATPAPEATQTPAPVAARDNSRPVPAAPSTRRLARELKLDINQIPGSGPAGRVTDEDVRAFASGGSATAAAPSTPAASAPKKTDDEAFAQFANNASGAIPFLDLQPMPDFSAEGPIEVEALRSIRRKVARKMVTSMTVVPHVAHMDEADVTELDAFRRQERDRRGSGSGSRLTLMAFVMKAVTAGLKTTSAFNASLDPFREEIIYKHYYNVGFAADTERGLVVPVIKDTDQKSIVRIADEIYEKATQARDGVLPANDMRGGTFTITNVGALGGTGMFPTINYPQVAILGMSRVQEKPVVRDGAIVIRKILPLTLTFDHRVADGAEAARFVSGLVRQLSDPNSLLLET